MGIRMNNMRKKVRTGSLLSKTILLLFIKKHVPKPEAKMLKYRGRVKVG